MPFNMKGVEVKWHEYDHSSDSGLSIIDALCNYGVDKTMEMIMK